LAWHTAINYEFTGASATMNPSIQVFANRDDKLPLGTGNDELSEIYRSSTSVAACVANGRIVSIAYADESPISIYTVPAYRNRGLATACLQKLVSTIAPDDYTPSYPTTIQNRAARRVATKVGYRETEAVMYWIEIPGSQSDAVPHRVWESLGGR